MGVGGREKEKGGEGGLSLLGKGLGRGRWLKIEGAQYGHFINLEIFYCSS